MSESRRIETPEVSFSLSGQALTLRDEAGGGEVLVELDGEPSLTRATTSWFDVPMDAAVSVEVERLRFPHNTAGWARGADGQSYGIFTEERTTLDGEMFVDVSAAMKIVVYVENGPFKGYTLKKPEGDAVVLEFDRPTRVVLGARSVHEEPTATMTVPDDPRELMKAVSHLGASIKEWSAERSWPTVRGHPPAISLGEELDIPSRLTQPDTGVSVSVPENTADVLRVAPLAHYFGAEIVPAEEAELRLDGGYTEPLGTGRSLEQSVDQLLARGLVLDSLVRIGGYYSLPRYEYDDLAPELPFYPPELYDQRIDQQLIEYLEVPFSQLEQYVPQWLASATLRPSATEAEALPFLLNSLSRVRVSSDSPHGPAQESPSTIRFSTSGTVPLGVASVTSAGRRASLAHERRPPERGSVVVIGSAQPAERCFARTDWHSHEVDGDVPSPEYRGAVSRSELATILESDPLYVHYAGEVTAEGFVCTDGVLPFDSVPSASIGGISFLWPQADTDSLSDLLGTAAVLCLSARPLSPEVVEAFAKYLVLGFSPHQSAGFVGISDRMRYAGHASLSLSDHANGTLPNVYHAQPLGDGEYEVSFHCRVTRPDELGSTVYPEIEKAPDIYYLVGSTVSLAETFSVADLVALCEGDHLLRIDGPIPEEIPTASVIHTSREGWCENAIQQYPSELGRPSRR